MTATNDFNAHASSAALAKFIADGDELSAEALVNGCNDDESRALTTACLGLACQLADIIRDAVHGIADVMVQGDAYGNDAVNTAAHVLVDVAAAWERYNGLDGSPTEMFEAWLRNENADDDEDDAP